MSEKSPLFISSIELLAHSIELLQQKNDRKNKFVILHLANCIELLLKDMLIDLGESIFEKGGNKTLQIWTSFEQLSLRGQSFPEKPKLEMLIDDRNAIQHKFGFPDKEAVIYYLEIVVSTFQRVSKDFYGIEFREIVKEYLDDDGLAFLGLTPLGEIDKVKAIEELDPASALTTAYGIFEKTVYELLEFDKAKRPIMIWHNEIFYKLLKNIPKEVIGQKNPKEIFDEVRKLRNMAVHRQHYDEKDMRLNMLEGIEKIKLLINGITSIPKEKIDELKNAT